MAYDKETIRQADKAGVFDSPTDAQVLETESEDRMRMKKELDDINKLDREKEKDFLRRKREKKDLKIECDRLKQKVKINIWDRIVLWFKNLFGGLTAQYKYLTKKELKRAKNIIQNFSPLFYYFKDPNSVKPRITKDFAQSIYSLYSTFYKIYKLFEDAVKEEEEINIEDESFFVKYETDLVSDAAKAILERLSKRRIYELYDHHDNARITVEKELNNFKNEIESSDYKNIETYSEIFEVILLLRNVDFESFFRLFDKNFVPSIKYKPDIKNNIYVNELRECDDFLKDLNMYLKTISNANLPENVAIHFDSVMNSIKYETEEEKKENQFPDEDITLTIDDESLKKAEEVLEENVEEIKKEEEETKDEEDKEKFKKYEDIRITSKSIKDFLKTVKIFVKSEIITAMVKYVYQDASYESKSIPLSNSFFEKYLNVISYRILEIANTSEQLVKDKHLKENIKSLFNIKDDTDININYIDNYNPIINKKLEQRKLKPFSHNKAIALIRMFFERHYFKYMTDAIDKLVVEGEFSDKSNGTDFSNSIYELEDDLKSINQFKTMMSESESVKNLLRGLNAPGSLDSSQRNLLSNKISEIDTTAKNIIESTLPKLLHIQNILDRALEDAKTKNPTYIYNIKTINSLANKSYLNQLTNISNKIKQFLNIMKNFHLVTKSQLKKK